MASIKDVAKRAGVSISTVSNVLNDTKYVSDDLKRKVMIAVSELRYEVDPVARNMKHKKSKTIGVITADMCGLFYPYVVKAIYEIANQKGYQIIICDSDGVYGQKDAIEKEKASFKQLISNRVDGIIFASVVSKDMAPSYFREIKKIASSNKYIPLVSIEQDFSEYGIDSIYFDGYEGAKMATKHLLSCGCQKVGHITGAMYMNVAKLRVKGYLSAMEEAGLEVNMDTMIAYGDYTHQSGYVAMKSLLEQVPKIDGVFVANDQMAVGVLKALAENNIKVPGEIKVIGYDNVFISSIVQPSLSTIHIRKRHAGLRAAELLFERIESDNAEEYNAERIEMEFRLVVRKSTKIDATEDWILSDW